MADPFYGEIRIFGFNFPPENWAYCTGAQVTINQYQALYAVIGTTYGGSPTQGVFKLPDLTFRAAVGSGSGPGLTPRHAGEHAGDKTVTITAGQAPAHTHMIQAINAAATQTTPGHEQYPAVGQVVSGPPPTWTKKLYGPQGATYMATDMLAPFQGGNQAHSNIQPYLGLMHCICTFGEFFPVRS